MRIHWTLAAAVVVAVVGAPAAAQERARKYAGRSVAEVLQELQSPEVRILFSSDLVPITLRVRSEPDAKDARQIAMQILAPHGLTLQAGPRGSLLVVVAPRAVAPPPRATAPIQRPAPAPAAAPDVIRVEERVEVVDRLENEGVGASGYSLEPTTVRETAGAFENPLLALQVLPGVAATNDEDGRLAVRGAGPEHNVVVLDGVQIHNPYRFGELTSSFLNSATAARITLDASGLDAAYGGRLSSVTTIETRDGRRDRRLAASGSLGLANGDVLLEGRLPKSASGSWWATWRGTYYRPSALFFSSGESPAFGDLQAKVTLRPSTRTNLSVFALAGREAAEYKERNDDGDDSVVARFTGKNRLAAINLSWTPGARLFTTSTVSMYSHDANDVDSFRRNGMASPVAPLERGVNVQDFAARQRAVFAISKHLFSSGVEVHRVRSTWRLAGSKPGIFPRGLGPSTWGEGIEYPAEGFIDSRLARTQVGAWLQDRWPVGSTVAFEPGVRLDWNSFTGESSWQPRLRVSSRLGGTSLWAGFAVQTQVPLHESLQGFDYFHLTPSIATRLRNERSRQMVVGFERSLGAGFALHVEAYDRRLDRLLIQRLESDDERAARLSAYVIPADLAPDSVILSYRPTIDPQSTGLGSARGIEVLLQRSHERASGWLGYTFSRTRRDMYGYSFPFDFDRPHVVTGSVAVALSRRFRLSVTGIAASGFPVTPLHDEVVFTRTLHPDGTFDPVWRAYLKPDGSYLVGPDAYMRRLSLRNSDRLSGYSRADVRVTYSTLGRWEFYGEVINVFAARNYRQSIEISPLVGGSERVVTENNIYENFERLFSFGVRVKF